MWDGSDSATPTPSSDSGQSCTVQLEWRSATRAYAPWACLFAQDFSDRLVLRVVVGDPDDMDFYDLVKLPAGAPGGSR